MRLIFMGTPEFAVPSLIALKERGHEILAVVTQPDRPANRGRLTPPPVKECAERLGLPVLQYAKLRAEGAEPLRALRPEVMVTCAYGQILSEEILAIAPLGVINAHASLLPAHRGSSPIVRAIEAGETLTGITTMRTNAGLDTGDMILKKELAFDPTQTTAAELSERLSVLAAAALVETLDLIRAGRAVYTAQDEKMATYEPMLKKEDGHLDFARPAREVLCRINAMTPWPSAYAYLEGQMLKIAQARLADDIGLPAGTIRTDRDGSGLVACGCGALALLRVKPEGKREMPFDAFARGRQGLDGAVLR